jgi:sulfur relay (sulfurtransferase) DsrF/TusC family protein
LIELMIVIRSGPWEKYGIVEGLRLSASMLGMDLPPLMVFLDAGVECLRPGAIADPNTLDYLRASADLGEIHVLSESLEERGMLEEDLDLSFAAAPLDIGGLAGIIAECGSVVAF